MKKTLLTLSFILTSLLTLKGEDAMRVFKSAQGQEMKAALIRVEGQNVKLRRADGREFTAAMTLFSADDQAYIKQWAKENALANLELDMSIKMKKGKAKKYEETGIEYKEWEAWYEVTLNNRTASELSGIDVEYVMFIFNNEIAGEGKRDGEVKRFTGKTKIALLKGFKDASFVTSPAQLMKSELMKGYVWQGGGARESEDRLAGLWVRLYQGDKLITEVAEPKKLMKDYTFQKE